MFLSQAGETLFIQGKKNVLVPLKQEMEV